MKEIQLRKWTIRPSVGGVCVDGLRTDDGSGISWHSCSIVKRINGRLLETCSGSRYRLIGYLDEAYAREVSDYLCRLISQFKRGFPKKWKSLIKSVSRAEETKRDGVKRKEITKSFQAPVYKTQARQNMADGKRLSRGLRSHHSRVNVHLVNCLTNKRARLSSKGTGKQHSDLKMHSVTRSMTKKFEKTKTRILSDSEGSSLDNTLDDTILALRGKNLPFGQALRKRKQSSDVGVASKKRKVEGRCIGQSVRPNIFPTPAYQNSDVLDGFASQRTSLKKGKIVTLNIEPDILTLESLLMSPENASEVPRKGISSPRIVINSSIVPIDLELEEDILQRSFMDCAPVFSSKTRPKQRSQTVQPKQRRPPVKQRKSRSQGPSKGQSLRSRTKSPDQNLKSVTAWGGHNLRPRTLKKDSTPGMITDLQRKSRVLRSNSRFGPRKQQLTKNLNKFENIDQMTAKKFKNNVVSGSKASPATVTVKSSLGKGSAQQKAANCDGEEARGHPVGKIKSGSKSDSQSHTRQSSRSRMKPAELEPRSANAEKVVVGQSKDLASGDDKLSIPEKSVVIPLMRRVQQITGGDVERMEENWQNQVRNSVHLTLMTMQASQIPAAKTLHPKPAEEMEGNNDATALKLNENEKNNTVNVNKITGEAGTSDERTSVVGAKDVGDADANNPQTIQSRELCRIMTLGSKIMERSECRNGAMVLKLPEHGKAVNSGEGTSITHGEDSSVAKGQDIHLKAQNKQIAGTPYSCGKRRKNIGKFSTGHDKLKMRSKTDRVTSNMDTEDTNESQEQISVPVKFPKPKERETVAVKNQNNKKKKNKETVSTALSKTENGQRTLQVKGPKEQPEENMTSETNIVPFLLTSYIPLEAEPTDECCLTKCFEENVVEKDAKVVQPKQTRKSNKKMAEIPTRVIDVKNQSQKSLPENKKDQKMKTVDKDDSLLANKNDQVTNVKLLGGRGTLKRQKELRKLIEKNVHCEDNNDFFSSTPFQNTRTRRFLIPQFEDGDDVFAEGDVNKAFNYKKVDVTPHGLFHVMDYTVNKTPATTPNTSATPAGIKRRRSEQEAYVHRVKKILRPGRRRGLMSRNILKKPPTSCKPTPGVPRMPVPSLDNDLLEVEEVQQKDSDEDDYYFADD